MNAVFRWIVDRTDARPAIEGCENRKIPGGASCWNVWPAVLGFTFLVQAITGLVLWMYYSPSAQTAWESVYYVQYEVAGGWLLRGIHHWAAQVFVALAALYVLQMIFRARYRAPREFVFWAGVFVGLLSVAMCLTGDLLAWTQNGYWATQVRVKFLTLVPLVGADLYKLAVGGPAFGHLTLTRFFALHAGVFAPLLAAILYLHGRALRRAEVTETTDARTLGWYWPNQAIRDAGACLAVAAVIGLLVFQNALFAGSEHAGRHLGVELGAPADPANAYAAARPEWSMLSVYELSNLFPGDPIPGLGVSWKIVPIFVIPTIVLLFVLAMPFSGRGRRGFLANAVVTSLLLVAAVLLSLRVVQHDRANEAHQESLAAGHAQAIRAVYLARAPQGIPAGGALSLLRNDPKTQGPELFQQHCAGCHNHVGGQGVDIKAEDPSASNLGGFATAAWIEGLLDPKRIDGPEYFGNTAFKDGTMVDFVKSSLEELVDDIGEEEFQKLIAALAEEARHETARPADAVSDDTKLLFEDFTCLDCHKFHDRGSLGTAPDLTGYGSREWILGIVSDPTDDRFYRSDNDRMPAYVEDPDDPAANILTVRQAEMLADWLRGNWYEPAEAE